MIIKIIRRLFLSDKKQNEKLKDLKTNPNFRTEKDIQKAEIEFDRLKAFNLEKGEVRSVFAPDIGNQKNLLLTKWYFKSGDIVKSGEVVCDIENEDMVMEFESVFNGRIWTTCKLNEELTTGTEIFRVEGVENYLQS